MTEKLYYENAYIKDFQALVLSCEKCGDTYDVVLDKTAFFPEEGGQYSDKGKIGDVSVVDVNEINGVIHHYTLAPLETGISVIGCIDFDERYEKMQCHSAEHILSGLIHKHFGLDNVGFHLGKDDVTMDISAPLAEKELEFIEELANEAVYKNVEITAEFPNPADLDSLEYRSKLDLTENVRIVRIGEYDACACCAPHVKSTGEIGAIKILESVKLRGGLRIRITAGRRAMKLFRECFGSVGSVSALLSVPKSEIDSAVKKLLDDYAKLKSEFSEYKLGVMRREAEAVEFTDGNLVIAFEDASIEQLIAFSNIALDKVSGILVLLSGRDGDYKYVISSTCVDLRSKISEINKSLLGRGGGRANMVQGSFASSLIKIKAYFNP